MSVAGRLKASQEPSSTNSTAVGIMWGKQVALRWNLMAAQKPQGYVSASANQILVQTYQ